MYEYIKICYSIIESTVMVMSEYDFNVIIIKLFIYS